MLPEQQKNMLLAITVSLVIVVGFNIIFPPPPPEELVQDQKELEQKTPVENRKEKKSSDAQSKVRGQTVTADAGPKLGADTKDMIRQPPPKSLKPTFKDRASVLQDGGDRVKISSKRLTGSIALTGARIDDLVLKGYRSSLDPNSEEIILLQPQGSEKPYYAEFGWLGSAVEVPNARSVWKSDRSVLSPGKPITLSWDNGKGLLFERVI